MNYPEALQYLFSLGRELAAPTQAAAAKFDLENISKLSERLGRPDRAYVVAHIAGTNGKGSTAAFLESILRHAGFRTGLYTSPHLERINERIRVNGKEIPDEAFAETFTRIRGLIEEMLAEGKLRAHPTFFECVTALAFEYFAKERVEFAVLETGLGGRLDATNIVTPAVAIITRIDFDHENFLGHSLREIAGEKAGILKPGVPLVLAGEQKEEAREVVLARAKELHLHVVDTTEAYQVQQNEKPETEERKETGLASAVATEVESGWNLELRPSLPGKFQIQNALNAAAAARVLQERGFRIPDEAIATGIAETVWPGRLEKLQSAPDIYLDGAHNPSAARELAQFVRENFSGRNVKLLYAAMRDKAVDEIAGILFPLASEVIFTEPRISRAISAGQLAEMTAEYATKYRVIPDVEEALEKCISESRAEDAIFVTGSLYLVGQVRAYSKNRVKVATR